MQEQLGTASDALAAQLAELRSLAPDRASASAIAGCAAQLASLNALQRSLSVATGGNLAALRADIGAAVAAASGVQQQARATVEAGTAGASPLAVTGAAIRHEVTSLADDLFNRRIFDQYLTFTPPEEAAYREREAERQRYIAQQLAKGTPEGELNAAGATAGQMLDANAHGAGGSPEFLPRWNRLADTIHKHREAMQQAGQSTAEYDREIAASTRRFLKSKGLTDSEIEARLSGSADPLEAVKPYLKTEQDAQALDGGLSFAKNTSPVATMEVVAAAPGETTLSQAVPPPGLEDVMAKLRASGVAAAEPLPDGTAAHGLTAQERTSPAKSSLTPG